MRTKAAELQLDDIHAILYMYMALETRFEVFFRAESVQGRSSLIRECLKFQQVEGTTDLETVSRLNQHLRTGAQQLSKYVDRLITEARDRGEEV